MRVRQTIEEAQLRALLAEAGVSTEPGAGTAARLDLVLTREGNGQTVLARGSAEARFQVTCARCLGPATIVTDEPALKLTFLPPSRGVPVTTQAEVDVEDEEPAPSSELEDVDTFGHDGESVDLRPVLRELLVLAIPMAPLCDEACKGLCPVCGVDRNHTSCGCEAPAQAKSPWARALADLKKS